MNGSQHDTGSAKQASRGEPVRQPSFSTVVLQSELTITRDFRFAEYEHNGEMIYHDITGVLRCNEDDGIQIKMTLLTSGTNAKMPDIEHVLGTLNFYRIDSFVASFEMLDWFRAALPDIRATVQRFAQRTPAGPTTTTRVD